MTKQRASAGKNGIKEFREPVTYIVHTIQAKHFIWISFYFCHIILHKSNFFACASGSHVIMKLYISPTIPKVSSKDTIIYSVYVCVGGGGMIHCRVG